MYVTRSYRTDRYSYTYIEFNIAVCTWNLKGLINVVDLCIFVYLICTIPRIYDEAYVDQDKDKTKLTLC